MAAASPCISHACCAYVRNPNAGRVPRRRRQFFFVAINRASLLALQANESTLDRRSKVVLPAYTSLNCYHVFYWSCRRSAPQSHNRGPAKATVINEGQPETTRSSSQIGKSMDLLALTMDNGQLHQDKSSTGSQHIQVQQTKIHVAREITAEAAVANENKIAQEKHHPPQCRTQQDDTFMENSQNDKDLTHRKIPNTNVEYDIQRHTRARATNIAMNMLRDNQAINARKQDFPKSEYEDIGALERQMFSDVQH